MPMSITEIARTTAWNSNVPNSVYNQLIRCPPYKHNALTLRDTLEGIRVSLAGDLKQNHDSMKIHLIGLELFFREDEPYAAVTHVRTFRIYM